MLEQVKDVSVLRMPKLSEALRRRTRDLHVQAERSGVVADIIRGRATLHEYGLLIRNLLPVYETLEKQIARLARSTAIEPIVRSELARSDALRNDLRFLVSDISALPVHPAAMHYVDEIMRASSGDGGPLIAHAYTRYLGDLSGGQIVKRLLARSLDLPPQALTFYDFPSIGDIPAFKVDYLASIDRAGAACADFEAVVEEGARAFELNIALSVAMTDEHVRA